MRKITLIFSVLWATIILLPSCTGVSRSELKRLIAQNDSLKLACDTLNLELNGMNDYLDDIALSLDSIAMEQQFLRMVDPETGKKYSRARIRENVELFEQILERQKIRIKELENSLSSSESKKIAQLQAIISHLNEEIERKDAEIARLKNELAISGREVSALKKNVASLENDAKNLRQELSNLQSQKEAAAQQAIAEQEAKISEGFVFAGSKAELRKRGIIVGGKYNSSASIDAFIQVDIRDFNEMNLQTRSAKILSPVPAGSYEFVKAGNYQVLVIHDVAAFWSKSNRLVIQMQ